jgi:lysophospholipase L1-like esterase
MKTIKYIGLCFLSLAFVACETDDEIDTGMTTLPALTAGSADFSTYVAVGASFTAGVSDGGLFLASQENSFPNTIAKAFANIGGGEFLQPLVNDNTGNITVGGTPVGRYRLVFGGGPVPLDVFLSSQGFPVPPITTEAGISIGSDFNNFGIPGARSFDLTTPGYAGASPYYARIASAPTATVLQDAVAQNPTFFTLSEIGGNDVLGYATTGGDGSNPITDQGTFAMALNTLVDGLTENGAKGAITNVPSIPSLPFFTTVPNNALALDAGTAASLTGFFQAVTGIFAQGLILQGVPPNDALALASQYAITFNEGPNRFLIDVAPSASNPLGFRQMTEDELLLLTINQSALAQGYGSVVLTPEVLQVLGILQAGGTPTAEQAGLVLAAVSGIDDGDALDASELEEIANAAQGYNSLIASIATNKGLAFVDLKSILEDASNGIEFDAFIPNTDLVFGGLVSLDGVHLTARGYALMANGFLEAIDTTYGSNFKASGSLAKADDFPVFFSPTLQ